MLLFRSEEHLERWRTEREIDRGATLTVAQMWHLAEDWYRNRLTPGWRRRTPDEAQEIFEGVGLTGPFWKIEVPR
jgi:hypothetical protein